MLCDLWGWVMKVTMTSTWLSPHVRGSLWERPHEHSGQQPTTDMWVNAPLDMSSPQPWSLLWRLQKLCSRDKLSLLCPVWIPPAPLESQDIINDSCCKSLHLEWFVTQQQIRKTHYIYNRVSTHGFLSCAFCLASRCIVPGESLLFSTFLLTCTWGSK